MKCSTDVIFLIKIKRKNIKWGDSRKLIAGSIINLLVKVIKILNKINTSILYNFRRFHNSIHL